MPKTIIAPDESIFETIYNEYGLQTDLNDPDAGNTHYDYSPLGELAIQTDANGNIWNMLYDDFGRITVKWDNFGKTINYYYVEEGNGVENISSIVQSDGISYSYEYDEFSRLTKETEIVDGQNFEMKYTYDEYGNTATVEYPSDFKIENHYDKGYLTEVIDVINQTVLYSIEPVAFNTRGQLTDYDAGNGLHTHKEFDQYGFPVSLETGNIQDLEYDFDPASGNLNYRKDNVYGLQENFTYTDAFKNRLNTWTVGSNFNIVNYFDNGNIDTKSDVGAYAYNWNVVGGSGGPHSVTHIYDPVDVPEAEQTIEYNSFNSVSSVTHDNQSSVTVIEFTYGPDEARKKTVMKQNGVTQETKYFIGGLYEKEIDALGNIREIHYIPGGDGLLALYIKVNGVGTMYYIYKDHLGSPYAITDENGDIVVYNGQTQRFSFDPWGNRRNPTDWTFTNVPNPDNYLIDRGFTGHEHLDVFGLINMNGRVYDPRLGRMLSPDNFVQDPNNSQNFNRYSYCLNNPLIYTDPNGYNFWHWAFGENSFVYGVTAWSWNFTLGVTLVSTSLVIAIGTIGTITLASGYAGYAIGDEAGAGLGLFTGLIGGVIIWYNYVLPWNEEWANYIWDHASLPE